MSLRALICTATIGSALASCGDSSKGYDTYALFRNLSLSHSLEVVYPSELDDATLRAAAERLHATSGLEIVLSPGQSASRGGGLPRIVIADGRTSDIEKLLEPLGIDVSPNGSFGFLDHSYEGLDDVVVATFADPVRKGLPITLYFGVDAAHALQFARDLRPAWRPAFRCWRDGLIEREGTWDEEGEPIGSAATGELEALAREAPTTIEGPGFDLVLHGTFASSAVTNYRERLRSVREETFALFGVAIDDESQMRLRVHVWPSAASLALATGTWAWSTAGPAPGQVNVVLEPRHDDGFAAARAWAVELAGQPSRAWMLDGLAAHLARSWWGKHLFAEWLPFLEGRGLAPPVQKLVELNSRESPHVLVPLRGALFGWLLERQASALLDAWRGKGEVVLPSDDELSAWIERESTGRVANWLAPRFEAERDDVFRRGIHLLPPRDDDARGFRGLGTAACEKSLRAARETGANAIALSPVAYLDGGFPYWAGELDDGPFATSTPDVALAATCFQSHGLHALFAPQLLTSRSGTWVGWTAAHEEGDWIRFFAELERCVVHYALLAELCNADVLCVGTELGVSTRAKVAPVDEAYTPDWLRRNTERWQTVIASARRAFRGALTYAAGSFNEARLAEIWPALDFVGLDLYRSLSVDVDRPTRPDDAHATSKLRASMQQLVEFARTLDKRALVTEIGFPATSDAWLAPERAVGDYDVDEQKRLFACAAEALQRQASSGSPLSGIYVWGWSTDPNAGRVEDRSFTPQNRPAIHGIAKLFGRE